MDFEAEAKALHGEIWHKVFNDPSTVDESVSSVLLGVFADALRRAYEDGAADALVKNMDAIAGDALAPVTQEGE